MFNLYSSTTSHSSFGISLPQRSNRFFYKQTHCTYHLTTMNKSWIKVICIYCFTQFCSFFSSQFCNLFNSVQQFQCELVITSQRLSLNDSMKLAFSIEATSFEQLEEHIFSKVIESCKINVIQQALILSHRTSNIREMICELTVHIWALSVSHMQIFLLFLLRKTRRRDQTEFSLSNLDVRISVWTLSVPSEPCIHLDMKIKPNVQIEGGQTAVYVIYAISGLERKDPTKCELWVTSDWQDSAIASRRGHLATTPLNQTLL